MRDELDQVKRKGLEELGSIADPFELESWRQRYLGRKGLLAFMFKRLTEVPAEQKATIGKLANQVKEDLAKEFQTVSNSLAARKGEGEKLLDITLPGRRPPRGHLHPITQTTTEICAIFSRMGFGVIEGPEVELDYYNFEALNMPRDHPARDIQDTFYISDSVVLRTHTSPMQIRVMEQQSPPVSVVAPGKVYRPDLDIRHSPMFHQVEGLLVDKGVSFADLKGTLTTFVHLMFGHDTKLRFRPGFFPFTEPSAEVDIQCVICRGEGCRTCSNTGWLEILGSGMVDPEVFKNVGYDPEEISGFAFGMGIERIAMLKSGLDDIRVFFENDIRFLTQF